MTDKPITKKAQHAAAVADRKWQAWRSKVRVLIGHMIHDRVREGELVLAYHANVTADAFAATLAAREPVGRALHPAKADAVQCATDAANETIAEVEKDLAANGWDLTKAAPYPDSRRTSGTAYIVAREKYKLYSGLTEWVGTASRHSGSPNPVAMSEDGKARFIRAAQKQAAFDYDAFICKMVQKVGECASATIEGSHIWSESTLTVTKLRDVGDNHTRTVERWRTHQILNVSKYGRYFAQWPSRLLK